MRLNIKETAELLGFHPQAIYKQIKSGRRYGQHFTVGSDGVFTALETHIIAERDWLSELEESRKSFSNKIQVYFTDEQLKKLNAERAESSLSCHIRERATR